MLRIERLNFIEFFLNPNRFELSVGCRNGWYYLIVRQTGGGLELFQTNPLTRSLVKMLEITQTFLRYILEVASQELGPKISILTTQIDSRGRVVGRSEVLTQDWIDRILAELERKSFTEFFPIPSTKGLASVA
jgi:hypothetical protein